MSSLGTVSHGTLRPEDLIPAFMEELQGRMDDAAALPSSATFEETESAKAEYDRLTRFLADIESRIGDEDPREGNAAYYESVEADWDLEQLTEELNEFAPPYCYFGTHEGDGADFGYWPFWDQIRDDIHDGELIHCDDCLPENPGPGCYIVVNDHGNTTLYSVDGDGQATELWAIV